MVIQMSELTLAAKAHRAEIRDPYGAKRRLSLVLVPRSKRWVGPLLGAVWWVWCGVRCECEAGAPAVGCCVMLCDGGVCGVCWPPLSTLWAAVPYVWWAVRAASEPLVTAHVSRVTCY